MGATMGKSGNILDSMQTENCHVVMLGLDSAGKTTALYRLKFDQYLNTVPTIGFNCEKVQGTIGKAKGVHFLIWDVGGQEKLRPLWRSYTRCTDGILFVVDSVDTERMEEAKMELMRTANCPDNHGAPVLILANKQDLPGACSPKDLEKLLGLYELQDRDLKKPDFGKPSRNKPRSDSNDGPTSKSKSYVLHESTMIKNNVGSNCCPPLLTEKQSLENNLSKEIGDSSLGQCCSVDYSNPTTIGKSDTEMNSKADSSNKFSQYKGWHIQPACAITGEGLQEGLGALYEMILKRKKLNKGKRKKARR